jgi:U3 small nucleolar RNA-associated protein 7
MPPKNNNKNNQEDEETVARRHELKSDLTHLERNHVRQRWVTDKTAIVRNKDVKNREKFNRNVPRRLAKHDMFLKAEDDIDNNQGLETEAGEVTDRVTQDDILAAVDLQTQKKKFSLHLDKHGPYNIDFSRNGTHMVFAGLRGHCASMRWQDFALDGEVQLKDRCLDVKYIVDHSMYAVAQHKYAYIYTVKGVEMHVLPKFANVTSMTYLHRHMLLAGVSSSYSTLVYMDVSTGELVSNKAPNVVRDPTLSIATNPANGVVVTGDTRGVLKMWSPSVAEPLVQIKGHRGGINHCVVHPGGRYTITCGADNALKVWDIRTLRALEEWRMSYVVDSIDVSQSGLVAVAGGTNVQVWKGMFTPQRPFRPWMTHNLGYGNVANCVKFCPFEDVLAIGHSSGISTMLVPSSGEPNPDFYEANPYESDLHRKDRVVKNLLDKLPPDTISMDLQISGVNEERLEEYQKALQANRKARNIKEKKEKRSKTMGDEAPTGLGDATVADKKQFDGDLDYDEIDEDVGIAEKGPSKLWKSKKEVEKEKKMVRWDQKDSSDKIRSKQTLRHSRNVMQLRKKRRWLESLQEEEGGAKSKSGENKTGSSSSSTAATTSATGNSASTTSNKGLRQKFTAVAPEVGDEFGEGEEDSYLSGAVKSVPKRRTRSGGASEKSESRMEYRKKKSEISNAALQRFL